MGRGVGFKVLTKKGLSGPYLKASILKGIELGLVPLMARLYDMEGERYVTAAELVGEQLDAPTRKRPTKPKLELVEENAARSPAKRGVKFAGGNPASKQLALPAALAKDAKVDPITAAADTQHGTSETQITREDAVAISAEEIAVAAAAAAPKPKSKDAARQINEVGELTSIKELILLEDEEPDKKDGQS